VNDGFRVDHEALARHAGEFGDLAGRAGKIAGELNTGLDALGSPWGDDEVGQSFSAVYSGPSRQTRSGVDAAAGQLDDMGTRLKTMAAGYRDVDSNAAVNINRGETDKV
jgi:uncharacterized protein YukE